MFLGIDLGTTAIKFGVIHKGKLLYEKSRRLTTERSVKGEHFQSAQEIQAILLQGICELPAELKQEITTIGCSTAMHSLMPVVAGKYEKVFIWSDPQANETMKEFRTKQKAIDFYLQTGTPLHAMSPFARLLYFKTNYNQETKWYGLKELMMYTLTNRWVLDYSTASATGLFSLADKQWSQEILDYININERQLAPLVDTTESFLISKETASLCGLKPSVAIMIGASDGCLAAYAGYISTGICNSLTIGTSAAVRKVSKISAFDPVSQNFCYYLNQDWFVIGAPSNNGGCILEWARAHLSESPESFYEKLPQTLAQSPVGAKNLFFYPYLNGERAPYWNNELTGSFKRLTLQHTRADMIRSVIEGILLNIRHLKEMTAVEKELTINGGFFKTPALRQLTADILGIDCYLSMSNEPIFGLYYLSCEQKTMPVTDLKKIAVSADSKQYKKIYSNYAKES